MKLRRLLEIMGNSGTIRHSVSPPSCILMIMMASKNALASLVSALLDYESSSPVPGDIIIAFESYIIKFFQFADLIPLPDIAFPKLKQIRRALSHKIHHIIFYTERELKTCGFTVS